MKPNRTIICNIDNYEGMSVDEIDTLIDKLRDLRNDKLTKRADEHADKLYNCICNIMDDGFVVYYNGEQLEPSDLDVRID